MCVYINKQLNKIIYIYIYTYIYICIYHICIHAYIHILAAEEGRRGLAGARLLAVAPDANVIYSR